MSAYEEFLRGERPDEVLMYLSESVVGDPDALVAMAETTRVEDGVVLVSPGEEGRGAFERATGIDPMDFAGTAMGTEGHVARDCTAGECSNPGGEPGPHTVEFLFAFAEEQNEEVGGLYAEGDVVHAYVACACDATYSDKWVADPEFEAVGDGDEESDATADDATADDATADDAAPGDDATPDETP